jgi:hypothetical protein
MEDILGEIVVAVIEVVVVMLVAVVLRVLSLLTLAGYWGIRFGVGGVKAARRALAVRRDRQELAAVLLELHSARVGIARVSDEAAGRIRDLARERRR